MTLREALIAQKENMAVVGLGYVGLPLSVAFSRHAHVIGFDTDAQVIAACRAGRDPTGEVGDAQLAACSVEFTDDQARLSQAGLVIIAVPTPIGASGQPDLTALCRASELVGRRLKRGAVVVYESTVYPGATRAVCIPLLERESGMTCGVDFRVGYSPERINPGDRVHRLETITKVVSAVDGQTCDEVAAVYEQIVEAGVYRAPSIEVAEAAKLAENMQRDINIAFMNELSMAFDRMGIDTASVLRAAGTKWNFLPFSPGLVGGHCVGGASYQFLHCAQAHGYQSGLVQTARQINEGMVDFVFARLERALRETGRPLDGARIAVLGVTFKENCADVRNSRVGALIDRLRQAGAQLTVCDPTADPAAVYALCALSPVSLEEIADMDATVVAVAHTAFTRLTPTQLVRLYAPSAPRVLMDIKGVLDREALLAVGCRYERL